MIKSCRSNLVVEVSSYDKHALLLLYSFGSFQLKLMNLPSCASSLFEYRSCLLTQQGPEADPEADPEAVLTRATSAGRWPSPGGSARLPR